MVRLPQVRFGEAYTVLGQGTEPLIAQIEKKAQEVGVPCIILDTFPRDPMSQRQKTRSEPGKPYLVITGQDAQPMMDRQDRLKSSLKALLNLQSENRRATDRFVSYRWVYDSFIEWSNTLKGSVARLFNTKTFRLREETGQNARRETLELKQLATNTYDDGHQLKAQILDEFLPWFHQVAKAHGGSLDRTVLKDRLHHNTFDVKTGAPLNPSPFPMDYRMEWVKFYTPGFNPVKNEFERSEFRH